MKPWADKWIANALSTKPMGDTEKEKAKQTVIGLYTGAGLPPPKNIIFVASPFQARLEAGFRLAALQDQEPISATNLAIAKAGDIDILASIDSYTYNTVYDAIGGAIAEVTYAATYDATWSTIGNDTHLRRLAKKFGVKRKLGLEYSKPLRLMWQSGNQGTEGTAFISFFRHIAKLPLDYSIFLHGETLSECSGPCCVHRDFCIISDRPEILKIDDQNRPHCDDGPFCRWRDGLEIYAKHGVPKYGHL
jgi:hypothetical protein